MSLFSGKRRGRSRGGVADLTPPTGQAPPESRTPPEEWATRPPHGEPHIDPLLDDEWADDGWSTDEWSDEWPPEWSPEADAGDAAAPGDELAEQEQSWDGDVIEQDDDVARRRRAAPAAEPIHEMTTPEEPDVEDLEDVEDVEEIFPDVPLPSSFRPVRNVPTNRARGSHGAGRFPTGDVVDHSLRSATRPYRLDPFMFDPSSILVERLGWYVDAVDVGAAAGFEALVFDVSGEPGVGAQLIVPSALDGWNFDSAVEELEDMQMRSSGDSDTAVGFDPDGHVVCVSSLQHVDVYAVRLIGTGQLAVAVEIADRYAQVIDDDL